jgi:hypothetical protein
MAKPTSSSKPASKSASKPASKGKKTSTTETTPVARPAIGKDDKALKEDAAAAPAPVAGKKRKSTTSPATGAAKDPEHDPETIKNTQKNSKTHAPAPKDAGKITPGVSLRSGDEEQDGGKSNKRAKVHVNKPAVTVEKTTEDVPLPVVASSSTASAGEKKGKGKKASKKDVEVDEDVTMTAAETVAVPPSATKPASSLKSALKSKSKSKKPIEESEDFIHGFSSSDGEDGNESVDDDDSDVDMDAGAGVKKVVAKDLPKVVEGDKAVEEKLSKAKRRGVSTSSTSISRSSKLSFVFRTHEPILCCFLTTSSIHRAKRRESSTSEGSLTDSTKRR